MPILVRTCTRHSELTPNPAQYPRQQHAPHPCTPFGLRPAMRRRRPPRRLLPRRIALVEPDLERSHAAILARPYHGRYPSFTLMRIGRYTSFTLMRMRMSRSSISCRVVEAPAALRGRSCTTTRLPPPSWAPAHAQPAGTRQNRHRLMSSSVPNMCGHEAAQSDLSAPSPPRSPTSALHLLRDRCAAATE